MLNNNAFKDVSVTEKNDIGGETALEVDKLETKSKKGLSARVSRMGIALGSGHNAPGGDTTHEYPAPFNPTPCCTGPP